MSPAYKKFEQDIASAMSRFDKVYFYTRSRFKKFFIRLLYDIHRERIARAYERATR
jgi:hypothetical protein